MKKKVNKNYSKNNKKTNKFSQNTEVKKILIKNVSEANGRVSIIARVNRVLQTGGPTIFVVSDGTGSLAIKGFIKPGERAYPEIEEQAIIKATIEIGEFKGEIEGEVKNMYELSGSQKEEFLRTIETIERERAKVTQEEFLVKSKILDKLKSNFVKAATEIRLAIIQDRPIIVRHHNDADGYSSGFALERSILPLVEKQHSSEKAAWEFFQRAPCAAPYYEIDDSIRDTANSLRNVAKFSNKMPLIIIADNGSSEQDLMAIKQGKIHGADFIVIDHHGFDKDVISDEVKVHINPFLVGEDGSHFSAGMLCAEIARFINPDVENISQIPAMAGFADMIQLGNPEVMEKYLKIAEKEGYTKKLLSDIALVIDYVSSKVRFMEVREYIEVLFGEPRNKQKELVGLMSPYIKDLYDKGLAMGKSNAVIEKVGKATLQMIDVDETFPGFGFVPRPGLAVGLLHDDLKYSGKVKDNALVTAGIMRTAITFRATDEANFSVHDLIEFINKKLPEAFAGGGGHKNAGSVNFLPYKKEKVVELLKDFMKKR
jgi:archaea-specific RecJ-like exonuclease